MACKGNAMQLNGGMLKQCQALYRGCPAGGIE